jgi:hypothetical protein
MWLLGRVLEGGAPRLAQVVYSGAGHLRAGSHFCAPRSLCRDFAGKGVTVPDLFVDLPLTEPSRSHSCGGFLLTASFLAGEF